MGGSTKTYDATPSDITGLRAQVNKYLMGTGTGGQGGPQLPLGGRSTGWNGTNWTGAGGPNIGPNGPGGMVGTDPIFMGGGPQPGAPPTSAGTGIGRIEAGYTPGPDQTKIQRPEDIADPSRSGIRDVNATNITGIPQANTDFMSVLQNLLPNINRGQVRDVGPINITPSGGTMSVDQLGGDKSAFFRNMMAQLSPSFDQRRAEGIAAAKEGAGNLTGTGFGNSIGTSINRSLGDEQAKLAEYATTGMQTEVQRQLADAQRRSGEGIAQGQLTGQIQQGNQQADLGFLSQLLQRGGMAQSGALEAAGLGQRGEQTNIQSALDVAKSNQAAGLTAGQSNQSADQFFQDLLNRVRTGNRDTTAGINTREAELDAARKSQIYGTEAGRADSNAQRFLQLLMGQSTAGVGAPTTVRTPGFFEQLLGAGAQVGAAYAGNH